MSILRPSEARCHRSNLVSIRPIDCQPSRSSPSRWGRNLSVLISGSMNPARRFWNRQSGDYCPSKSLPRSWFRILSIRCNRSGLDSPTRCRPSRVLRQAGKNFRLEFLCLSLDSAAKFFPSPLLLAPKTSRWLPTPWRTLDSPDPSTSVTRSIPEPWFELFRFARCWALKLTVWFRNDSLRAIPRVLVPTDRQPPAGLLLELR